MYRVDEATCTGCGDCVEACPAGAIALVEGRARIDDATCTECGRCADVCLQGASVMAVSANVADTGIPPQAATRTPARVVTSVQSTDLARSPVVEVLPSESRRGRVWPIVGGALVWAARELLPEMLAAWRTSHAEVLQPTSRKSVTFGQVASQHSRTGHRHRWGRT
jgi:NAD-dependent dihydropyrimidine dehydrogenase PreA subunit